MIFLYKTRYNTSTISGKERRVQDEKNCWNSGDAVVFDRAQPGDVQRFLRGWFEDHGSDP